MRTQYFVFIIITYLMVGFVVNFLVLFIGVHFMVSCINKYIAL